MPYTPKTWENKPSTASPINATNLNHMEGGIKTNDDNIVDAQNAILTLQGEMLQAQGDISALETLVDSMLPVDTESGNPAVITDAFGGACKSLKLTLAPIQSGSGTPSPQNVRPISGLTEANVVRTGKNLCPLGNMSIVESENFNLKASTYTFSFRLVGTGKYSTSRVIVYDSLNNEVGVVSTGQGTQGNTYSGQFTISEDKVCRIYLFNYNDSSGIYIDNIQMEIGTTATPYEPYNGESITRTYGTTIYGGSDDVTGEGVTIVKDAVDLGSLEWEEVTTAQTGKKRFRAVIPNAKLADTSKLTSICSNYALLVNGGTWPATNTGYTITAYSEVVLYDDNLATLSATDFKAAMNGVTMVYELITPTSIPMTAQNITLLKGDNVLTTDADSIEASYSADIALYIAKKIAEGSNNRSLSKGGSGDEESKEEEKEEVKEEDIEIKEAEPLTKEVR